MSIKGFWEKYGDNIVVFCIVLLAVGIAFLSGRLSVSGKDGLPVKIRSSVADMGIPEDKGATNYIYATAENINDANIEKPRYGLYVASKNSKVYHLWNCPSVNRIKDDNKIWFDTVEEAEETGRIMANDCKSITN